MAYIPGKNGEFSFTDGYLTVQVNWSETYDGISNTSILSVDSLRVKSTAMLGAWYPSLILQVDGQVLATMQYFPPATHMVTINAAHTYAEVKSVGGAEAPWVSLPILHDAFGSRSVELAVVANPAGHNLSSIQLYRNDGMTRTFGAKQAVTLELTDIPRRSTLSVESGTLGQAQSLTVERSLADYTHTVTCTLGGDTRLLCEKSSLETISWTPPLDWAYHIPNAPKASAVYRITTFSADKELGWQEVCADLAVPEHVVPTVTASWLDTTGTEDFFGTLVQLVSALEVTVEGRGAYGSTITSAAVTLAGKDYSGGVLLQAGELPLVVTVTDSRGRMGRAAYSLTVAEYAVPTVDLHASRCDADGTPNDMGEFACITVSGDFSPLGGGNIAFLELLWGDDGEEVPFHGHYERIVEAPSVSAMPITAILRDVVGKMAEQTMNLSIGYATLDFLAGGRGIAFGTTAKEPGFVCAMPARFLGGVEGVDRWTEENGCLYRLVDGEREWLNPPMELGEEYRTLRRCKGKPIYTKLIACTGLDTTKGANTWYWDQFVGATEVIACAGYGYNPSNGLHCTIPYRDKDGNGIAAWAYHDGRIVVASSYAVGYTTAYLTLEYIKN